MNMPQSMPETATTNNQKQYNGTTNTSRITETVQCSCGCEETDESFLQMQKLVDGANQFVDRTCQHKNFYN